MARIFITGFPDPPPGEHWCSICAALVKTELVAQAGERIEAALADADREVVAIAGTKAMIMQLETGVMWGPHPRFPGMAVLLCWTHAPALGEPDPPPRPGPPQGLLRGLS